MTEIMLGIVCLAQTGALVLVGQWAAQERRSLLNRLEAKNPAEFVALERLAKPAPPTKRAEAGPQPHGL